MCTFWNSPYLYLNVAVLMMSYGVWLCYREHLASGARTVPFDVQWEGEVAALLAGDGAGDTGATEADAPMPEGALGTAAHDMISAEHAYDAAQYVTPGHTDMYSPVQSVDNANTLMQQPPLPSLYDGYSQHTALNDASFAPHGHDGREAIEPDALYVNAASYGNMQQTDASYVNAQQTDVAYGNIMQRTDRSFGTMSQTDSDVHPFGNDGGGMSPVPPPPGAVVEQFVASSFVHSDYADYNSGYAAPQPHVDDSVGAVPMVNPFGGDTSGGLAAPLYPPALSAPSVDPPAQLYTPNALYTPTQPHTPPGGMDGHAPTAAWEVQAPEPIPDTSAAWGNAVDTSLGGAQHDVISASAMLEQTGQVLHDMHTPVKTPNVAPVEATATPAGTASTKETQVGCAVHVHVLSGVVVFALVYSVCNICCCTVLSCPLCVPGRFQGQHLKQDRVDQEVQLVWQCLKRTVQTLYYPDRLLSLVYDTPAWIINAWLCGRETLLNVHLAHRE